MLPAQLLPEGDGDELAVGGRQPHAGDPLDQLLVPAPVLDQVCDGDHLQTVAGAVPDQVRDAGHRPVVVHDLADDTRGVQARESRQVDRRLGLARPLEDAAGARPQREDVAALDQVVGCGRRVDRDRDRVRAVGRGDAGRDPVARVDRGRVGGAEPRLPTRCERPQLQLVAACLRQAEADHPPPVSGHEVDRLRRRELGGDRQIAFVLAVRVVDDDHEPAGAEVLERLLDRRERAPLSRRRH